MERLNTPSSPDPQPPAEALRAQQQQWLQPLLDRLQQAEAANDWQLVEQLCKQILQRDGENWGVWQRLALAHEARKDWTQAETLWRHLTQRFSNRPEPYLALAELQRRQGTPDAARAVLEEAERRVGGSEALRRSLAVIDDPWAVGEAVPTLSAQASALDLGQALQMAQDHLDRGRFTEAEAVLQQILVARPAAVKIHLQLARLRQRRGDHQLVADQLLPLYTPFPDDGALAESLDLPLLLVSALQTLQRDQEALTLIEPLKLRFPQSAAVLLRSTEVHLALGDAAKAFQDLQLTLALNDRDPRVHALKGQLSLKLGDPEAAVRAFEQVLALDPTDRDAAEALEKTRNRVLWHRGELALARADWPAAERHYRQLLERDPRHQSVLDRLDLVASLRPAVWSDAGAGASGDARDAAVSSLETPQVRLQAFSHALDRVETQLKMLGVLP